MKLLNLSNYELMQVLTSLGVWVTDIAQPAEPKTMLAKDYKSS